MTCTQLILYFLVAASFPSMASADWGDYADDTFNCPAMTTCKQVCVPNITDCPIEMLCQGNETLCGDGSCSESCDEFLESPCLYGCAPVACAKFDDFHTSCLNLYGPLYDFEAECGAEEIAEATHLWSFTEPGFVFFYAWISGVTFVLLTWCAYNQRFSPVPGSTQPLQINAISGSIDEKSTTQGWQNGYKFHPIGVFLNFLTVVTLFGIQGLLFWLCIQYYIQQEAILSLNGQFDDEEQVLLAFVITWSLGFFWSFALKFPYSIRSLHYRRCVLGEATHVAICVQNTMADDKEVTFDLNYIQGIRSFFASFYATVHDVMTFVFSDYSTFGCPRTSNGVYTVCPVEKDDNGTRFITFRFRRYNLDEDKFVPGVWDSGSYIKDIVKADKPAGLSEEDVGARRHVVGRNTIRMERPAFLRTLKREISKPFYTYQTFMIWTWVPLWYYYMAIVWAIVVTAGALVVSFFQYRNERSLYKITKTKGEVEVLRNGQTTTIPHQELVPGDIISVSKGTAFCDMVVVSSHAALVDESALTGEAAPVGKTAVDHATGNDEFSQIKHKRHIILAGTTVVESDSVRAIVRQTASFTARGELIRDIYSYKRHQFKFDIEVPIVITILFFYAIFGFFITNYFVGENYIYGFFYGMYVVSTILPPLLPTVFTVSVGISDHRLTQKRVACTSPESILVAGKVTRAFFDKTGTLTKQGLDFMSVRSSSKWDKATFVSTEMTAGMAVCNSLTQSKDSGELVGNPVDCVMFEASGAKMAAQAITDGNGKKLDVVKHFDFDHHRMTQSVIVRNPDNSLMAYVKGSGENIKKLCSTTTIPANFDAALRDSASQGIYQISMARKPMSPDTDLSSITREEVESALAFLGVINFKNSMRADSPSVIQQLREGEVRSIMITGDSILTGICIAKESGILGKDSPVLVGNLYDDRTIVWVTESDAECELPSVDTLKASGTKLAISGAAFSVLCLADAAKARHLMELIRVYGRCNPHDKVAVVSSFVNAGFITMMCGDGGNDCGALKAAHVGVALSDAEASTVAPFTSLDKSISSVVEVLKEGRCALASALASYKYMIMYGQMETLIQMMSAYFALLLSEWCWVFMDGIWTISLAFALPLARPAKKLAPSRPTASILGLQTVSSVLGVLLLNFVFIVGALGYLWNQEWFQCRQWANADLSNALVIGDNYEAEVIFLVGGFQYITTAMAFNFGYEFRLGWFRNYVFVILSTAFAFIHLYITLVPGELSCVFRVNCENENVVKGVTLEPVPIQNDFNTTLMPEEFRRVWWAS